MISSLATWKQPGILEGALLAGRGGGGGMSGGGAGDILWPLLRPSWGSARCRAGAAASRGLVLQLVVAACRAADIWRVRERAVGLPRCWQVLWLWGQVTLMLCQPVGLAPWGFDLPNPAFLKKQTEPPVEQGQQGHPTVPPGVWDEPGFQGEARTARLPVSRGGASWAWGSQLC